MPTVFQEGQYTFIFFSSDRGEPPHIHVTKGGAKAKFWLRPVALASNFAFDARTLRELEAMVEANVPRIERVWNEHFG